MFIVPTDLYFSEFDGDWDDDSDAYYGEPISPSGGDAVDYFQEIFIGRIMVTSASEVRNWTNKVETYELNPGNGDPSYVTKAFFTQADQMQVDNQARDILNNATWITDTTIFEEEGGGCTYTVPDFPTGSDVIDEFNNHYGFCSFMTHGRPCAIGVASLFFNSADSCNEHALAVQCANNSKYKVTAFDNGVSGCGTISENGNGFDNMTNYYHPSIYYSVSCTTMPFDDYKYVSSASERNMGESFTCISEGGGPVYLGNTRPGLTDHSFYLFGKFIDAIVDSNFFNVGITESASKDLFNYSGIHNYITFSHNLLGCPETEIWTAVPSTFSSASVTKNGSSVTVNTGGVSGATICVMSALDNGNSYYDMHTGTSHTFTNVPELYYATIDKHNKIPYTRNPTSVLIQNETLNSYGYLSCQTVSAGYSVDPNKTYGNVLIEDGASITFDATGDILLDNGFEVELGATFEAK
jgi:hypothetical protein